MTGRRTVVDGGVVLSMPRRPLALLPQQYGNAEATRDVADQDARGVRTDGHLCHATHGGDGRRLFDLRVVATELAEEVVAPAAGRCRR